MPIIRAIHKYQKQLPCHHIPKNGVIKDRLEDENLTSKKMNMSRQRIITSRSVMTYFITSRAMNSSLMDKLWLNAPFLGLPKGCLTYGVGDQELCCINHLAKSHPHKLWACCVLVMVESNPSKSNVKWWHENMGLIYSYISCLNVRVTAHTCAHGNPDICHVKQVHLCCYISTTK